MDFDASRYLTFPPMEAGLLTALATKLLTAAPAQLPVELTNPLKQVRACRDQLDEVLSARLVITSASSKRDADMHLDHAWGALHLRLSAWTQLDPSWFPECKEAKSFLELLFPEGLSFLTLAYEAEWAESNRRIQRLDSDPVQLQLLEVLVGARFVEALRRAHDSYGVALGITKPRETTPNQGVAEPMKALRVAIGKYARRIVGMVDEDDVVSVELARSALLPIDEARASRSSSSAADSMAPPDGVDGAG